MTKCKDCDVVLAYKAILKQIQFSATQIYDAEHIAEYCCPVCGGQGYHENGCKLAALLNEKN